MNVATLGSAIRQGHHFGLGLMLLVAIGLPLPRASAQAPSEAASALSQASAGLPPLALEALAASAAWTVHSLQPAGETVVLVLRSGASAASVSLRISRDVALASGLALGSAVSVVSEAAGMALMAGGTMIAFIPNAAVAAMQHRREWP